MSRVHLLEYSGNDSLRVAHGLQKSSDMHEVGVLVSMCPRTMFVLQVLHSEFHIGRCPMRLDRRDISTDNCCTRIVLGHYKISKS